MAGPKKRASLCTPDELCERCRIDREFLQTKTARKNSGEGRAIRIVDLFCGCGGMTVGLSEAARRAMQPWFRRRLANAAALVERNPQLLQLRALQVAEHQQGATLVFGMPGGTSPIPIRNAGTDSSPQT